MNRDEYTLEKLGPTVTCRVAARVLGCSPSTISRMCRKGRLKAAQAGVGKRRTHWRINTTDLLVYARMLAE